MQSSPKVSFSWRISPHPPTLIEIVKLPEGESPEWVRKHWVGVRLPISAEGVYDLETAGVLSAPRTRIGWWIARRMKRTQVVRGYLVNERVAIEALLSQNEDAGRWWIENVRALAEAESRDIIFDERYCRVVKPEYPTPANS